MIQSNEETGNKRPVMISLKEKTEDKEGGQEASMDTEQTDEQKEEKKGETDIVS